MSGRKIYLSVPIILLFASLAVSPAHSVYNQPKATGTPLPLPRPQPIPLAPDSDRDLVEAIEYLTIGKTDPNQLVGLYAPGIFRFKIVEQPDGNAVFVSPLGDTLTNFLSAKNNGITGLLAHNYLAGRNFYDLEVGDSLFLIWGDRRFVEYLIVETGDYQKLSSDIFASKYIDLATGETLTTDDVFTRYYRGNHRLTLQTCLERKGDLSWGLHFITARRAD